MEKVDHRKVYKTLYSVSAVKPATVTVPPLNYLQIDGAGSPGSDAFAQAIETLYPVAYTLKFMVKRGEQAIDYRVMPLQGLWWAEDMAAFTADRKDDWLWTAMILQPPLITAEMVAQAVEEVGRKKNPPALDKLRFDPYDEGLCAQILHKGPFDQEGPTIEKLHDYIEDQGYRLTGKHHEIYLSDFRRTAPKNLKTIIRQPMG